MFELPRTATGPRAMTAPAAPQCRDGHPGWRARLVLGYAAAGGRTFLREQEHQGPLLVQKPFYPEGPGVCHTYVIHPPGGVVGGDRLEIDAAVASRSHALITTPSAAKFYRSNGPAATQTNRLAVADGAVLEWLPQETIVYNQANARLRTCVLLEGTARFIGWEILCLGLKACGQPFARGRLHQYLEIRRDNQPVFIEPLEVRDCGPVQDEPWGLNGNPVIATMVATTDAAETAAAIREEVAARNPEGWFAATHIKGLIVSRYLGADVYEALSCFAQAWTILRPEIAGRAACPPRIWAT